MKHLKILSTFIFAAVAVAAVAGPKMQNVTKLQPQKSLAKIDMQAKKGDLYTGKAGMMKDFTSGVDTMYLTPKGTFFSAFFPYSGSFFYSYYLAVVPGNTELTWTNISTGITSDTYDWVYYNPGIDKENLMLVEGEKDLVCTFPNYPGWWIAPKLFANAYSQADVDAGNYFAFNGSLQFGGKFEYDVLGDGTVMTGMYQFSPRASYNKIMRTMFSAGYGEDANAFFADLPDALKPADATNGKIVNFIQYFNYPGKPYAFSRIQLYAYCSATAGQTLTAKVCRVEDRDVDFDNPIATAVYEFPAAVSEEITAIDFYFEKEDQEDWLVIDDEIAVVIDGVNEVAEIAPILNAISKVADDTHEEFKNQLCNGYAMWDFYDASGEVIETSYIPCHMGYYWGSGNDSDLPVNHLLSINAQFAYIETVAESATEYTIPATGGEYTLKLKASEPYNAWAVEDIPEWMTIEAENEMETDDEGNASYTGYTTLTVNVQPGHNGEVVCSLPGTEFKIKVGGSILVPGDANDDGAITIADYVATARYILERNPQPFDFASADLDDNNAIDVNDLVGIAYLVLHDETDLLAAPSVEMPDAAHIALDATVKNLNGCYEIAVNMSNNIPLTAMQMDLALPEGMTLIDASLSDRANASHQLDFNLLKNGSYRLLASSPLIKSFNGNDGTVLNLTVAGEPMGQSRLTGIKFVAPNLTSYSIDDVELNFTPTAIDNIYSGARIYNDGGNIIIMAPADGKAQIILPNGASTTVNVVKGKNAYPAPASGIVVVKMNDEVKKLFIH